MTFVRRAPGPAAALLMALALAGAPALRAQSADSAPPPRDGGALLYPRAESAAPSKGAAGWGGTGTALLVIVFGAAAGWAVWNRVRGGRVGGAGAQDLSIAETRSLGNRQFLVVAAYQGRKFLLGVCPGRIDLLAPLDGGPTPPAPRP